MRSRQAGLHGALAHVVGQDEIEPQVPFAVGTVRHDRAGDPHDADAETAQFFGQPVDIADDAARCRNLRRCAGCDEHVDHVDDLFAYMENDGVISRLGKLESKPEDAEWGERFFHALDPDGYKLSFATPI